VNGSVSVEHLVQDDALALALPGLDRPGLRVATEQNSATAAEGQGLDDLADSPREVDLGASSQVQTCLDNTVVAECDAESGVCAKKRVLADGDDFLTATRERAHDGRATSDVTSVADRDALRDTPLHHRGAERSRVVVDETLVHHGGPLRQVCTKAHPVYVGDTHPRRNDVVDHAREPVDAEDEKARQVAPSLLDVLDLDWAVVGPGQVRKSSEDVEVGLAGLDESHRNQQRPQERLCVSLDLDVVRLLLDDKDGDVLVARRSEALVFGSAEFTHDSCELVEPVNVDVLTLVLLKGRQVVTNRNHLLYVELVGARIERAQAENVSSHRSGAVVVHEVHDHGPEVEDVAILVDAAVTEGEPVRPDPAVGLFHDPQGLITSPRICVIKIVVDGQFNHLSFDCRGVRVLPAQHYKTPPSTTPVAGGSFVK